MKKVESERLAPQLWSPVQNISLWYGWWLHGIITADDFLDSLIEVFGPYHYLYDHSDVYADNDFTPTKKELRTGSIDLLHHTRSLTQGAPLGLEDQPLVSLVLTGPGDVPPLPAGTEAAQLIHRYEAGILLADSDPEIAHLLVPHQRSQENSLLAPVPTWVEWHYVQVEGRRPAAQFFSVGEAEEALRESTIQAAALIEKASLSSSAASAPQARLAVGSLSDAFGLPGLPPGVPLRSTRLMARADMVAATIEVARQEKHSGSVWDPYLLPLARAVRQARMTAVDYAMRELFR